MKVKKKKNRKTKKYTTDGRVVLCEFNLMKFLVLVGIIIFLLCTYLGVKTATKAITINKTNLSSMALVEEDYTETVDKEQAGEDNEQIFIEEQRQESVGLKTEQIETDQEENLLKETNTDVVESEEIINSDENLADDTTDIEKDINSNISLISDEDEETNIAYTDQNENEVEESSKNDVLVHLSINFENEDDIDDDPILGAIISLNYKDEDSGLLKNGKAVVVKFINDGSSVMFYDVDWDQFECFNIIGWCSECPQEFNWIGYDQKRNCWCLEINVTLNSLDSDAFLKSKIIWDDNMNEDGIRPDEIALNVSLDSWIADFGWYLSVGWMGYNLAYPVRCSRETFMDEASETRPWTEDHQWEEHTIDTVVQIQISTSDLRSENSLYILNDGRDLWCSILRGTRSSERHLHAIFGFGGGSCLECRVRGGL